MLFYNSLNFGQNVMKWHLLWNLRCFEMFNSYIFTRWKNVLLFFHDLINLFIKKNTTEIVLVSEPQSMLLFASYSSYLEPAIHMGFGAYWVQYNNCSVCTHAQSCNSWYIQSTICDFTYNWNMNVCLLQ